AVWSCGSLPRGGRWVSAVEVEDPGPRVRVPAVSPLGVREPTRGEFGHRADGGHLVGVVRIDPGVGEDVDMSQLAPRAFRLAVEVDPGMGEARPEVMDTLVHTHRRGLRRAEDIGHHGDG